MARLHRYKPSSENSGYHLRGRSHKSNTTFQVGRAAEQLIDWLEIKEGERIPDELLWQLFDLGLIWTESGGRNTPEDSDIEDYLTNIGGRQTLTETQKIRLRQFIEDYDGVNSDDVRRLESIVSDIEYRQPAEKVKKFSDKNELSDIAKKYYSRDSLDENVVKVLENHGFSALEMQKVKDLPAIMVDSIPDFNNSFFELTDIEVSSSLIYTFSDPEMWIGDAMVWTEWRLFDSRKGPEPYLEAEFEIDTDHWNANPPVIAYTVLEKGEPSYFEIINGFESGKYESITGTKIEEYPFKDFQEYVYDCLCLQLDPIDNFEYKGPGSFFERG